MNIQQKQMQSKAFPLKCRGSAAKVRIQFFVKMWSVIISLG